MISSPAKLVALVLSLVCVALCYPCFRDSMNIMDDMPFHLNRIQSLAANLSAGNILPTIYGDAINNYGYAAPLFYPDFWLYIPALLTLAGIRLIKAYQFFLLLITIATAASMYYATWKLLVIINARQYVQLCKEQFLSLEQRTALLATILYLAFPYRLIDVYMRGALGEVLAFIFLPLIICGIAEILYTEKRDWQMFSLGLAGLLYSHVISFLMISMMLLLIILFAWKRAWKARRDLFKACLVCAGLGAAFLLPLIEQMASNRFYYEIQNPFGSLFEQAIQLSTSPDPRILLLLNITALILFYFLYGWLRSKNRYPRVASLFFATFYLMAMTTNLFPWPYFETVPLLKHIQFPWRLFLFISYVGSILASIVSMHFLKKMSGLCHFTVIGSAAIFGVCILTIFVQPAPDITRSAGYSPSSTSIGRGEYLPAAIDLESILRRNPIPILTKGSIKEHQYSKTGNQITFKFRSETSDLTVEFPVIFYKGYCASINNQPQKVFSGKSGLLHVEIMANILTGQLDIYYMHTFVQWVAYVISFITTIALVKWSAFITPLKRFVGYFF